MPSNVSKFIIFSFLLALIACTKSDCPPTTSTKLISLCPLKADYEFNGNTNDTSSYGIIAINYGATLATNRFGNTNSAYSFNGTSNYILADTNNRGITNRVTVSAWIRTTSAAVMAIVEKYHWEQDHGYGIAIQNNKAQFSGRDGSGVFYAVQSQVSVNDGQWHLITGVYRGTQWEIWVDGLLSNTLVTGNTTGQLANIEPLSIGIDYDSKSIYFNGEIDEVKLWNCALDAVAIAEIYNEPDISFDSVTISGSAIKSSEVRLESPATNLSGTSCLAIWTTTVNSIIPIPGIGFPDIGRSFIQFDYSKVPSGANISSATLYLYADTAQVIVGNIKGATQLSRPNNWVINALTSPWNTSTITWNNQPSYDTTQILHIPATSSPFQNYTVDITSIVQHELSNPSSNYGIVMLLAKEIPLDTVGLAFYNGNGPAGHQPKLVIKYK